MEGGQLKVKPLSVLKEGSYNCPEERLESLEQKFQEILSFLVKLDIQVLDGQKKSYISQTIPNLPFPPPLV